MHRSLWLVALGLVVAGCGDDSNRRITDAPQAGDGAPIDAPPPETPVTVTVTDNLGPHAMLSAYFQNVDSSVVSSVLTDSAGSASAVMVAGGYVTVVVPQLQLALGIGTQLQYSLYTWAGVKPGDHLVLDKSYPTGQSKNVQFTLPIDLQHIFSNYHIASNCGSADTQTAAGSSQSTVVLTASFSNCPNDTADVIVYTTNQNGTIASSFSVLAQPIVDQGMVDYTANAYGAPSSRAFELDLNDVPSAQIYANDHIATARGELYVNQIGLSQDATAIGTQILPALPAGSFQTVRLTQNVDVTSRTVYEFGTTGDYTRDWSTVRIPDFDSTTTPDLDTGTHALTWLNTAPTSVAPDVSAASVYANRALGATTNLSFSWFIAGPATTPSLVYPALPTDIQDFNIKVNDGHGIDGLGQLGVPGGYDAVRATIFQTTYPILATGKVSSISYDFFRGFVGRVRSHVRAAITPDTRGPFLLRRP